MYARQILTGMRRAELLPLLALFKSAQFDCTREEDYPHGTERNLQDALSSLTPEQASLIEARLTAQPVKQRKAYIPLNELAPRLCIPSTGAERLYSSTCPYRTPPEAPPCYSLEAQHHSDLVPKWYPKRSTRYGAAASAYRSPTRDTILPGKQPHWITPMKHQTTVDHTVAPVHDMPRSSHETLAEWNGSMSTLSEVPSDVGVSTTHDKKRSRTTMVDETDVSTDSPVGKKRRLEDDGLAGGLDGTDQRGPSAVDELLRRWTIIIPC